KVATKNAIGNGISIGWIGWPAMLAVLRGFRIGVFIAISAPPDQSRWSTHRLGAGLGKPQRLARRAVEDSAVRVKPRAVAGAIPTFFVRVPLHDTAEMRADGAAPVQDVLLVSVNCDF